MQASPARWNPDKLKDINGLYIRKLSGAEELAERIAAVLIPRRATSPTPPNDARARLYRCGWCRLVHERLEELGDAPELLEFFFTRCCATPTRPLLVPKKMDVADGTARRADERVHGERLEWAG